MDGDTFLVWDELFPPTTYAAFPVGSDGFLLSQLSLLLS